MINVLDIEPMSPHFKQWASNKNMCVQIKNTEGQRGSGHVCRA